MNHIQHHHTGTALFCHVKIWLCFALVLLVVTSCRNPARGDSERGGPGLIIPGESIEGVKLGDSQEFVKTMLGEPEDVGLGDGFYRSWWDYRYFISSESVGSGLIIYFIQWTDTSRVVDALAASYPYHGATPEGIRIGSSIEELVEAYGEPDEKDMNDNGSGRYFYCGDENIYKYTSISVRGDSVKTIFIGYHIPILPLTCRQN